MICKYSFSFHRLPFHSFDIVLFFWPCCLPWEIYQGLNLDPWQWKHWALTTEPQGHPLDIVYWYTKICYLVKSSLISFFPFVSCAFGVTSKKLLPNGHVYLFIIYMTYVPNRKKLKFWKDKTKMKKAIMLDDFHCISLWLNMLHCFWKTWF